VRWGRTPKNAVQLMIKRLRESGAMLGGFVMTMVDERRHARYGDAYGLAETAYLAKESIAYHSPAQNSPANSPSRMARRIGNRMGLWMLRIATMEFIASRRRARKPSGSDLPMPPAQALLVINMDDRFIGSSGLYTLPNSTTDRLIKVVSQTAERAKTSGMLVISIQTDFQRAITKVPARLALGLSPSSTSGRVDPHLGRRSFTTRFADAFSNPELDDFLRTRNVKHLFLAGLDGMLSVNRTARGALKRNYQVTFVRDGIGTVSEQAWQKTWMQYEADAALAISSQEFAEIFSYADRPTPIPAGAPYVRT
jgi:nicotinamidase-related amidase